MALPPRFGDHNYYHYPPIKVDQRTSVFGAASVDQQGDLQLEQGSNVCALEKCL